MSGAPPSIDAIHRYVRTPGRSGEDVARLYWAWLDRAWGPLVSVQVAPGAVRIRLLGVTAIALTTTAVDEYAVVGGLLARAGGSLRFTSAPDHAEAALLGFRPALPIWLYRLSHGPMHDWTMRRFGHYLEGLDAPVLEGHP